MNTMTKKQATTPARLEDEIRNVQDVLKHLQIAYREHEQGRADRYGIMALLFLTETYLGRYAALIEEQLQEEERRLAEQAKAESVQTRRRTIYLLANRKDRRAALEVQQG